MKNSPILLILPAMGVKAIYYEPFIHNLVAKGIMAISTDLRGIGMSSIRPSKNVDFGYFELVEDLKKVVTTIKQRYPNQKVVGLGHSLGGQIASLAQAKYNELFDGLILVAANSVYYKGWKGKQKYLNLIGFYFFPILSRILGYFPGDKIGFGGRAAKTQMSDWSFVAKKGHFKLKGDKFDYEEGLKKMKKRVLAIYIEGDWMSPKAAMEHLYQKFHKDASITNFTLNNAEASSKLNHFNWVKYSDKIVNTIINWV